MVLVEWVDSYFGYQGWHTREELEDTPVSRCVTCGFLLKEAKDRIVVGLNISDKRNAADGIAIPKQSIMRIRKLKIK